MFPATPQPPGPPTPQPVTPIAVPGTIPPPQADNMRNIQNEAALVTQAAIAFSQDATDTRLAQHVNYVTPAETKITANLQAALATKRVKKLRTEAKNQHLPARALKFSIAVNLAVVRNNVTRTVRKVCLHMVNSTEQK